MVVTGVCLEGVVSHGAKVGERAALGASGGGYKRKSGEGDGSREGTVGEEGGPEKHGGREGHGAQSSRWHRQVEEGKARRHASRAVGGWVGGERKRGNVTDDGVHEPEVDVLWGVAGGN